MGDAQIAAFADSLDVHESPSAFAVAQEGEELRFASQSFVGLGLWADELLEGGEAEDAPKSAAMFTGEVLESAKRRNSLTGEHFVWASVECLGGVYDLVAAASVAPESPTIGSVVQVMGWLSGRPLEEPAHEPEPKRERIGFFRRIRG